MTLLEEGKLKDSWTKKHECIIYSNIPKGSLAVQGQSFYLEGSAHVFGDVGVYVN
jgi:hypothetical protein